MYVLIILMLYQRFKCHRDATLTLAEGTPSLRGGWRERKKERWMDKWAREEWERKRDFDVLPLSWNENNIILPMGCCEITQSQWKATGELRILIFTWQPWWSKYNSPYPSTPRSLQSSLFQSITLIPILRFFPSAVIFLMNAPVCLPPLVPNPTLLVNMSTLKTCDFVQVFLYTAPV